MQTPGTSFPENELNWKQALPLVALAAVSFQLAYSLAAYSFLIAVYLWSLFQLTRLKTSRQAFYLGLAAALLCYSPQSGFFWKIFGPAAIPLWLVLSFWVGLFALLGRLARRRLGNVWGVLLIPFLWTGLEYFRSELYYLRFSWFNVGYAFSSSPTWVLLNHIGMYGIAFLLMAAFAAIELMPKPRRITANAALLALLFFANDVIGRSNIPKTASPKGVHVAGVQLEFPSEELVVRKLDGLVKKYPDAQLLLLSEYTFTTPVPEHVKNWCRKNQRYLVVGAEEPATGADYYDTAFVVGPTGDIVFQQGKSVPIQFFKDGLPAREQKLWDSPWGKIGFCVCYDLSYSRVTDQLIRLGAQAIIVPTMDVVDWGRHQHELHARVVPTRVAEYGVPIFRLASSGISQFVDASGILLASVSMPGEEATLYAWLQPVPGGRLPWDRMIAPVAVVITAAAMIWFAFCSIKKSDIKKPDCS